MFFLLMSISITRTIVSKFTACVISTRIWSQLQMNILLVDPQMNLLFAFEVTLIAGISDSIVL